MSDPKILAIESSCDETAAAVTCGRRVLSSAVYSQIEAHSKFGGVVPEIASRMHVEAVVPITEKALFDAGLTLKDIDGIAVTYAPGLIGALLVGVNYAKGLSFMMDKPLIPVHHLRSHIAANYIDTDLKPPFLCLVVSGGHSHIVEVTDYISCNVIARTRDDAAGECFDKAARAMGLPYPGGVHLDRVANTYKGSELYSLPRPKVEGNDLDFSFSGLKTAVVNLLHTSSQRGEDVDVPKLCFTLRQRVCEMLCRSTLSAVGMLGYDTVVLSGGVSANSLLRKSMSDACERAGYKLYYPELSLCGDNAAMVGVQGYYELLAGNIADMRLNAFATMDIGKTSDS